MAKNTKSGLGRGLNSLLGGYEAAMEPSTSEDSQNETNKKKEEIHLNQGNSEAEVTDNSRGKNDNIESVAHKEEPEREVIREEDLPQEDRDTIDLEKKEYIVNTQMQTDSVKPKTVVKDVVAKKEYIEDNDGVRIVGLVEREAENGSQTDSATRQQESIKTAGAQDTEATNMTSEVPIEMVKPNPSQPRMHFNKIELEELASSIRKDGLLQPILVRSKGQGYEIIAGERRWQACKLAGLKTVPVRITQADDMKTLELALIENLQRSDLNPIEEAYGYKRMMERGGRTQSDVAAAVSKGRSTIANALRLLDLPEDAQQLLYEEKITSGHARAILSIPTEEGRKKLTEKLKNEKLSVREAEAYARLLSGKNKKSQGTKTVLSEFYKTTAKSLSTQLDTKVRIRSSNGKNKLEIEFSDEDELKHLLEKFRELDTEEN